MSIKGTYRHFKGNNYEVLGEASEKGANESYVFYRQLYDPFAFWIRPKDMFFGKRKVGEDMVQRFVKIAEGQKDILSMVDLFSIKITHTETKEIYKVIEIIDEIFYIQKVVE